MLRTRSARFAAIILALLIVVALAAVDAGGRRTAGHARLAATERLARWAGVTDPCLFTDARYTRHPSLADHHSAFQDYPLALEHFPSGALVPPPPDLADSATAGLSRPQ